MYSSLSADILHLGIQPVMKGRQGKERERERQIINKGESRRVDGDKHACREAGRHFVIFAGSEGGVWNVVAKTSLSASWNNRSRQGRGGVGRGGLMFKTTLFTLRPSRRHQKHKPVMFLLRLNKDDIRKNTSGSK